MILPVVVAAAVLGVGAWDYSTQAQWAADTMPGNQCGVGGFQSPINLDTAKGAAYPEFFTDGTGGAITFSKLENDYAVRLLTNKHTWEVQYATTTDTGAAVARPTVAWGGKVYSMDQFHFHSPSEHLVDGKFAAMEMHMVHTSLDEQSSLVVAVLLDVVEDGEPHPFLKEVWPPSVPTFPASDTIAPNQRMLKGSPYKHMVPKLGHMDGFMQYMGSLTTPPCTINTVWLVMMHRAKISSGQLSAFRAGIDAVPNNQLVKDTKFVPAGVPASLWNSQLGVNNREQQALGTRQVYFYEPGLREKVKAYFEDHLYLYVILLILLLLCLICCIAACVHHICCQHKREKKTRAVKVQPKRREQPQMVAYQMVPAQQQVQMVQVPTTQTFPPQQVAYQQQPLLATGPLR